MMARFNFIIGCCLIIGLSVSIVHGRTTTIVQEKGPKSLPEVTTADVENESEGDEVESSSISSQGGSDRDGEGDDDEGKTKIPGHTNTVIIVYLLVLMTIIVKTAPNAIYYLLPKIEIEGGTEEKMTKMGEDAVENDPAKQAASSSSKDTSYAELSRPQHFIVIVEGNEEGKGVTNSTDIINPNNCVHSFTLHV